MNKTNRKRYFVWWGFVLLNFVVLVIKRVLRITSFRTVLYRTETMWVVVDPHCISDPRLQWTSERWLRRTVDSGIDPVTDLVKLYGDVYETRRSDVPLTKSFTRKGSLYESTFGIGENPWSEPSVRSGEDNVKQTVLVVFQDRLKFRSSVSKIENLPFTDFLVHPF